MSLEYRIDHRGVVQVQAAAQRSYCWPVFVVLLLLLMLGGAWLYFSGYLTPANASGGLQTLSLRGKMDEQARMLEKQQGQIIQLESQTAAAVRSRQVQDSANESLRSKLLLAESELSEARQRLLLYEDILSPQDLVQGLHIQHFAIKARLIDAEGKKLADGNHYQYHLVLANIRGGDTTVSGHFDLKLSGKQAGKSVLLDLAALLVGATKEKQADERFSLKYYQSIEGNIVLPQSFEPEQAIVTLVPESGAGAGKVTETYGWDTFKLSRKSTASKE